ncbi:NAD(P)H-dependent oxidoreductase [Cytobacillus spongiae]|jgi:azobenzene reductase|uniref:NADPH-dependent FMN reductase n=1 Tax=Cytobacillus spongiae TaxID=2901381 RepID=UPI001F22EE7A|nr:NADPH-dependent FMN reductase [Cytobacillus spongiae]UII56771.1 NAD(P)H-dependent oxidoreductase [Cytobacillus spongiae]
MNVIVVNGSPRKKGRTGIATSAIARTYGAHLIDLSDGTIPLYNGEEEQAQLSAIQSLRQTVKEADGVIIATPEYHNAMSGALKNMFDFLSSEQFSHKPVALLAVAGGGKGGMNALNSMRTVVRGVYANAIPKQVVLDPHCFDYENDGLNEESAHLVKQMMEELTRYMNAYQVMKG